MKYVLIFLTAKASRQKHAKQEKRLMRRWSSLMKSIIRKTRMKLGQICLISEKNLHCCT